jgi:hypothetical protein
MNNIPKVINILYEDNIKSPHENLYYLLRL